LALALDEPRDNDEVFDIDDFKFLVDKSFMEKAKPIKVDFIDYGFRLSSSLKLQAGCGGCGGDTSCSV
jgi:Fe-S cluster assembly iron-binding protein IscA